jgi:hypothetical protein
MEDIAMVERSQAPLRNSLQSLITEREELRKAGSETEKTLEEELQTFRVRPPCPATISALPPVE